MSSEIQYFVFGDSLAYGAWDKEGGWAQRLKKFIDQKFMKEVLSNITNPNWGFAYPLGISGETVGGLLKRIKNEIKPRMKGEKTVFIFSTGMNDLQYINAKGKTQTSSEKFKKDLQHLINFSKKFSSKIIFVGLNPVVESKADPLPWNKNNSFRNEHVKKYNEIMKSVCAKNKVYFIEIFERWITSNYEKLIFEDGLHPNSEGHEKIFETVKNFLIANKMI